MFCLSTKKAPRVCLLANFLGSKLDGGGAIQLLDVQRAVEGGEQLKHGCSAQQANETQLETRMDGILIQLRGRVPVPVRVPRDAPGGQSGKNLQKIIRMICKICQFTENANFATHSLRMRLRAPWPWLLHYWQSLYSP